MSIVLNGTTGIQNVLGSASSPADTNTTTPTTGVYYPSATTWGVSTAGTNALYIDASQNVGIGTTSPAFKLDVSGTIRASSDTGIQLRNSANQFIGALITPLGWGVTSGSTTDISVAAANNLTFFTGNSVTERMRIDSSGNVGIGTTSTTLAKLTVAGTAGTGLTCFGSTGTSTAYNSAVIQNGSGSLYWGIEGSSGGSIFTGSSAYAGVIGTGVSAPLQFATANNIRATIDSSGNFTLAGTTSQIISLGTYNNTTASASNVYIFAGGALGRSTSAIKYKQDIRDLESIDITKFRPVRYKSKCEGDDQTKDHFGFIADEVDSAGIKELISYGAEGEVEGFQYERMTAVLVKAIQELKAEFDAYKVAHP